MKYPLRSVAMLVVLIAASYVIAQTQPADVITYFDREKKKEDSIKAFIQKESPVEVSYKGSTGKAGSMSIADIREIEYGMRIDLRQSFRKVVNTDEKVEKATDDADRKKAFDAAFIAYSKGMQEEFKDNERIRRDLQYRLARLHARAAEEDASYLDKAIEQHERFLQQHPQSWQYTFALKQLGRLQEAKGDVNGASKTYGQLAALEGLPKEMQQEADLLQVRAFIRAKKYTDAEKKLQTLSRSVTADDPQAARLQVYLAECQVASGKAADAEAKLKQIVAGSADGEVKALAHNTLGEACLKSNRQQEAFWHFLWVDVVYNQDKHEQARALYNLADLFDKLKNDPPRAQQCLERLAKEKDFAGTEYQRLAQRKK